MTTKCSLIDRSRKEKPHDDQLPLGPVTQQDTRIERTKLPDSQAQLTRKRKSTHKWPNFRIRLRGRLPWLTCLLRRVGGLPKISKSSQLQLADHLVLRQQAGKVTDTGNQPAVTMRSRLRLRTDFHSRLELQISGNSRPILGGRVFSFLQHSRSVHSRLGSQGSGNSQTHTRRTCFCLPIAFQVCPFQNRLQGQHTLKAQVPRSTSQILTAGHAQSATTRQRLSSKLN